MKILLLYGRSPSSNCMELATTAKRLGNIVTVGSILHLSSMVSSSESRFWLKDEEVTEANMCFIRSFGPGSCEQLTRRISMIEHLEVAGILVVNPTYSFRRARDKYATQYTLSKAGLPIAKTYTTENIESAYKMSKKMGVSVYKPILGSEGKGALKFGNPDLAYNAWKMLNRLGQPLIVQEYIKNAGRDIRVFVVGKEVIGSVFKYAAKGQWKTNVAQGGRMIEEPVSEEVKELALKANEAIGLFYSGVDVIESDDGPLILEVNGSPGWQALKKTTGIDVAEKIVKHMIEECRR